MKTSIPYSDGQVYRWGIKLVIFSLVLILAAILFPYNFSSVGVERHSYSSGFFQHVFLFLPFGFGITCLMQRTKLGRILELIIILAAGSCLSLATEAVQTFSPSRSASLSDALANILGTFLGSMAFWLWGPLILGYASTFFERIKRLLTVKILITTYLGYLLFMFLITLYLLGTSANLSSLANWDDTFPLILGNEHTGNRPWRGHIYQLEISNRAISEQELAQTNSEEGLLTSINEPLFSSYQFTDGESYSDRLGNLPELICKGESCNAISQKSTFLGIGHWLETAAPATFLAQELQRSSQFTLSTIVATANTLQIGPARIVSLSGDPYHRNFTLGQQGRNLVFRLRTPLTGENGLNPELTIPDVFNNTDRHNIVVTYDGSVLKVFVDGVPQSPFVELKSESVFSAICLPSTVII